MGFFTKLEPEQIKILVQIQEAFKKNKVQQQIDEGIEAITSNPTKKAATMGLTLQIMPYLALILVIMVIISFVIICTKVKQVKNNPAIRKARQRTLGFFGKIKYAIKTLINRVFGPILKILAFDSSTKGFLRMMNPMAKQVPSVPREQLKSGRCDNMKFVENRNQCEATVKPDDILWELDISKFPEYYNLPIAEQKRLEKRLKVYIPWQQNASFYVPQCNKARFQGEVEGSASKLLLENGTTCRLNEIKSEKFESTMMKISQTYS